MKVFRPALVLLMMFALWPTFGAASDLDTPIIVQEILVSVQNHRRVLSDMDRLTSALQNQSSMKDVMDFPSVKDFVRDSLEPSNTQLQTLFARYRDEYGERSLQKLAKQYRFTDLLQ